MLDALSSTSLTFFLLFISIITASSASGNETDHIALLKLRESISSDPFGVLISWNSSNHFCNWHGVTCGNRHQRVIELNLSAYHLRGFIPPHVGNLSFLRYIHFGGNNFFGEVPKELGRLFRLQYLNFVNNTLGGEFPINLTNCSQLKAMGLQGNNFTGPIPNEIGLLGKLELLAISKNNFNGRIPSSIGNISSLIDLSLAYNNLEGNIPKEIGHLNNLEILYVGANKLSGTLPSSLYNLSSLTAFSVATNQIHGHLPANMFLTLPNITNIGFAANQFSGPIPISITNGSRLQLFDIGENQFVGQVPSLGMLRDLSFVDIASNNLGSNSSNDLDFLTSLINCSQLNTLELAYNNFGGQLPNFIGNLSTQLNVLLLQYNHIYGIIPKELGNLVNLNLLDISFNYLTKIIPATLGKFGKMQLLDLSENKLSGEIPVFIGNLSELFELDLSQNMFIGNIPSTIGNCKNLQSLDLSRNNLSGAIPTQLIGLSKLSVLLNLSHNSFVGGLPTEVGMLKNIDALDLSHNYLSGNIPETIGRCESLEYFYLQRNSFQGSIPHSLASLKGLRKLDLSQNNLSGLIPEGLQKISTLEYFNASFNMLEGEVPITGIFHNASAVSLIGNSKLCGGVLELKLPPCPSKAKRRRRHHKIKLTMFIVCSFVFLLLLSCILTIYQKRKRQRKESSNSAIDLLPMVSYQSLHNATNGFSSQNLIGTGSLGFVYKGSLNSEERVVAIKVLNHQKKGAQKSFIAECNALRNIRHRNLVKVFTCCSSVDYNGNEFKALIFEYMSNGSLEKWLHPGKETVEQPRTLKLEKRLEIMMDVALALNYLHYECDQPIVHRDLKPSNILLDDDMVAHVSDFGLATILSAIDGNSYKETSTSSVIKGTIGYAPPEYGMSSQVSTEGDIYSYGILLLEILTGKNPTEEIFKDGNNLHNYVEIAFPNNILEIVDSSLLSTRNEYSEVVREDENNTSNEVTSWLHQIVDKCLFSLFRIGLACSMESPKERMNVTEVIKELNTIKKSIVAREVKSDQLPIWPENLR